MATSMQFGPEWMRKAANRSSSSIAVKDPASPNPNSFPDAAGSPLSAAGVFGSAAAAAAGGASNGVSAGSGALPASPAVASPSGFSFAEAAAGLSGDREPRERDRSSGTVTMGSSRLRLLKRGLTDGAPPSPSLTASLSPSQPASPTIQATNNHQLPTSASALSNPAGPNASVPGVDFPASKSSNPISASPGAGRGPGGAWPGSRLHRQRSLAEGGGPIGPPADGSAGFHKFAGYDRKRERQHSAVASSNGGGSASNSTPRSPSHDAKEMDGDTSLTSAPEPEKSEWSPETAFWLYKDPSGQVQGPFNAVSMQEWYKQRYFTADLLIKRQEEEEFTMLGIVLAQIGDTSTPFLQPPRPKQAAPSGPPGLSARPEPQAPERTDEPVGSTSTDGTSAFQANGGIAELAHVEPDAGHAQPPIQQRRPWPNLDLDLGGYAAPNGPGSVGPAFGSNGVPRSPFTASAALLGMSPHAARQAAVASGSPFGIPSVANLALDDRLRQQDELLAFARQRELQEQRQAAAAAAARAGFGVGVGIPPLGADSFGALHAGPVRRPGWEDMPPSAGAMPASPAPWQQFGLPPQTLTGPAVGGPGPLGPFFESFGQSPRPIGPGHNVSWTASSPMTPARMPFERPLPQEAGDDPFVNHTPNHVGSSSPWPTHAPGQHATAPNAGEMPALAAQQLQGDSRFNSIDSTMSAPAVAPVGTPRRSVSPAPPSTQQEQAISATQEPPTEMQELPAEPNAELEAQPVPEPVPAVAEQEPQPEPEPAELPAEDPEELWPADPSAVEFAPEQSFEDAAAAKAKIDDSASAQAARRTRRGARQLRADGTEDDEFANTQSTGSVRIVGQDQFKRSPAGASANSIEAPLSAWLPDANGQGQTPSSATFAKPAPWASKAEDETTPSSGPSLREIQAAEARNAEVKRSRAAAERAVKASLTSVTSPGGNDSALPATMSWGLASVPPNGPKEAPIVPASQGGGNAWQAKAAAASSGVPKKTLMEIQEEERKRAQRQSEIRSAQAAAIRKGYADSASRSISNPAPSIAAAAQTATAGSAVATAPSVGGAWSVVGAGGKTAGAPSAPPPGVTRAVSGTPQRVASGPAANGWTTAKPVAGLKAATPSSTVAAVVSNGARKTSGRPTSAAGADASSASQPSPEFLQYCKDHLKGLNIRVDDFIEMLLSFPLDPSPDVIEIIAESVYANSSTLDGRRFASDFVAKRKLDAQGRFANGQSQGHGFGGFDGSVAATSSGVGAGQGAGGAGGAWTPAGSSGRTASEVLKSQPAASKNESPFGFKVVKAKGNKKRS